MDPNQLPQTPQQEPSVEDWFKGLPSDQAITTPIPASALPPEPSRKTKRPFVILAITFGALLLLSGGAFAYWYASTDACLSASDYKNFTGKDMDTQQSPSTDFYTSIVAFDEDSSAYTEASQSEIEKMANFYTAHSNTSMIFTITSNYGSEEVKAEAVDRNSAVASYLISLGVAAADIRTSEPFQVTSDSELSDKELDSLATTYVSISSAETCR